MTATDPSPRATTPPPRRRRDSPGELAALEEQRDFLLRSLDDLEREREAGDVDDADYEILKDDYTARAAAVLRAIERRNARYPVPAARRTWPRTVAWVAGVVAFAVVAGMLVAQGAGQRAPGEVATGDIRQTVTQRLNEAGRLLGEGRFDESIERYDSVLVDQPSNPEALTYRAWALRLSGERGEGLTGLLEAAMAAPEYPDVHALLAVVFYQEGLLDLAARELELLEDLDPPAQVRELVAPLEQRIAEAAAGG